MKFPGRLSGDINNEGLTITDIVNQVVEQSKKELNMSKFIEVTETKKNSKILINASVIDGVRVADGKVQFLFNNGEVFEIVETYEHK